MKTLHLNLMRVYFANILRLFKKEEYRQITPYWCSKFLTFKGMHQTRYFWKGFLESKKGNAEQAEHSQELAKILNDWIDRKLISFKKYPSVTFSNGMTPPVPRFEIEFNGFEIREGKTQWGAKEGEKYFVLKLGAITSKKNIK